ncbi:MAG TPA: 1-phosphofructokinase [Chloroflexota bacterium]|nr:1-phosphofructokinase [Chloroflexota bacterium]
MIVTLTLNPAVDKTIRMPQIATGEVNRVQESLLDPGGKGINVTRLADRLGWPSIAFGFLGGEIGEIVERSLQKEGVQSHFVQVPGQTRLNVTIFDESTGRGTSFYDRGPEVSIERINHLTAQVRPWLLVKPVLVLAGSLPLGAPDDVYADYIALAHSAGAKTMLDTTGEPLRLGVRSHPYLVKPNVAEAEQLVGRPLTDLSSVVGAAQEIHAMGAAVVVISMGAQGAICLQDDTVWHAIPPRIVRRSTVGSGDSMVAGLAISIARGEDISTGLRLGTAAGAATAMVPGTALGDAADIARLMPQVRVTRLAVRGPQNQSARGVAR